jgi:hypothetical protein
MVSVTLVSLSILLLVFRRYERGVLALVEWSVASNRNLVVFVVVIIVLPLLLMVV